MTPAQPAGAHCAHHADVPAVVPCARCGTFLCEGCLAPPQPGGPFCIPCATRTQPASRRATLALTLTGVGLSALLFGACIPLLGLCALALSVPIGLTGLVLAVLELKAIDRGEAPEAGRRAASTARTLGLLLVGLVVAALVAGLALSRWFAQTAAPL